MQNPRLPAKFKRVKKFDIVKQRLLSTAEVLGPGAKFPTVRHLCHSLQVSVITLDRVLKQLENEGIIIRQHGSGIYVSSAFGRLTIGLVYDRMALKGSPFHGLVTDAVLQQCAASNRKCLFYLNYPMDAGSQLPCPHDLYQDVLSGSLNGILTVGVYDSKVFNFLSERRVPVVALGSIPEVRWRVMMNYSDLVEKATLRALEKGCRRIGLLLPFDKEGQGQHLKACRETFVRTLRAGGVDVSTHVLVANYRGEEPDLQQFGFVTAVHWLSENMVDGVVSADDMITFGVLQALQEMHMRLTVVSHGNHGSSIVRQMKPSVDVLEFDPQKLVAAMLQLLNEQLHPEAFPEGRDIVIRPEWGSRTWIKGANA